VVRRAGADLDRRRLADAGQAGTRAMSMSTAGSLSRSFIVGTRLWPPAMSLPVAVGRLQLGERVLDEVARW
jgi:hypothetical protein